VEPLSGLRICAVALRVEPVDRQASMP